MRRLVFAGVAAFTLAVGAMNSAAEASVANLSLIMDAGLVTNVQYAQGTREQKLERAQKARENRLHGEQVQREHRLHQIQVERNHRLHQQQIERQRRIREGVVR